eukprot:COSAG02_NODE_4789_length_4976_cov_3.656551_4_plen_72_part_00
MYCMYMRVNCIFGESAHFTSLLLRISIDTTFQLHNTRPSAAGVDYTVHVLDLDLASTCTGTTNRTVLTVGV